MEISIPLEFLKTESGEVFKLSLLPIGMVDTGDIGCYLDAISVYSPK